MPDPYFRNLLILKFSFCINVRKIQFYILPLLSLHTPVSMFKAIYFFQIVGNRACDEKLNWLENNKDSATAEQITQAKTALEDALRPIMAKLKDPCKYNFKNAFLMSCKIICFVKAVQYNPIN